MAEFGVKATELRPPQAEGSTPLRPVQDPGDFAPDFSAVGGLIRSFGQGGGSRGKQADPWDASAADYALHKNDLLTAYNEGNLSSAEYRIKSQKLNTQYIGMMVDQGFGQGGIEALEKVNKSVEGISEVDELYTKRSAGALDAEQNMINKAVEYGFISASRIDRMSAEERQEVLVNMQNMVFAERQLEKSQKQVEEVRKQQSHDVSMNAAQRAESEARVEKAGQEWLTSMHTNITTASSEAGKLVETLMAGGATFPQAKNAALAQYAQIRQVALQRSNGNPEVMRQFDSTYGELFKSQIEVYNPQGNAETSRAQVNNLIATQQLKFLSTNPKILESAAGSALFPNTIAGGLVAETGGTAIQKVLAGMPQQERVNAITQQVSAAESGAPAPAILNNNEAEQRVVLGTLRASIRNAATNTTPQLAEGLSKNLNTVLKGVGQLGSIQQAKLAPTLDTFASDEMKVAVERKLFDTNLGNAAALAVTETYGRNFGLPDRLAQVQVLPEGQKSAVLDGLNGFSLVSLRWEGAGVRKVAGMSRAEERSLIAAYDTEQGTGTVGTVGRPVSSLAQTFSRVNGQFAEYTESLNKYIKTVAHLEGRTDYENVWKERRSEILPQMFPAPNSVEEKRALEHGWDGIGSILATSSYKPVNKDK